MSKPEKKVVKKTRVISKTITIEYDDGSTEVITTMSAPVPCGSEDNPC